MKIIFCLNSIRYLGGIQKVTIVKANALAEIPGNEIYLAVSDNKEGVQTEPLSEKVKLIDLNVNYYADDWKSKWAVIKGIFIKRREHKRKLTQLFNEIIPDIVISVGQSEKNMLPEIKGPWKTIREFHFDKKYRLRQAKGLFQKVLAIGGNIMDNLTLKKYNRVVVLTHEDKDTNWKGFSNVSVIPNPITIQHTKTSSCLNNKVISVGRLQMQKNYSSLISAFKLVVNKHPDWILEIWGEGGERKKLEEHIQNLQLGKNVFLKGQTNHVASKLQDASIFALSSIFEGFGLVLLEAMSIGLPVVSYECPCGPRDIIFDGINGFLAPVNDEKTLADRICQLIENEDSRHFMSTSAQERAKDFSLHIIIGQWMQLFATLTR